MKIRELKELLTLISERNITEFELEEEGVRIKIRTEAASGAPAVSPQASATTSSSASSASPTQHAQQASVATTAAADAGDGAQGSESEDGLVYVTAPMVGTFYRQPEPGSPPFVREGDSVKMGQVLCIIEAMKLMNEIECEHQGELVKAFIDNGQPVQYGDRLFAIRST